MWSRESRVEPTVEIQQSTVNSRQSRVESRESTVEPTVEIQQSRVDSRDSTVDSRQSSQQSRFNSRESRVESRESRVESRESRVESRESRVESRESRVESRESRVESRESRVESRESRVESRESRVESRESRVESRESRVESRESRVESRESRVESRESTVEPTVEIQQSTVDSRKSRIDPTVNTLHSTVNYTIQYAMPSRYNTHAHKHMLLHPLGNRGSRSTQHSYRKSCVTYRRPRGSTARIRGGYRTASSSTQSTRPHPDQRGTNPVNAPSASYSTRHKPAIQRSNAPANEATTRTMRQPLNHSPRRRPVNAAVTQAVNAAAPSQRGGYPNSQRGGCPAATAAYRWQIPNALSCHILLRFKSYSNDVKSHYVVVLFVCTR